MNIFAYLLLQLINGSNWNPVFGESNKFKNWIAILDLQTCLKCRMNHGRIWYEADINYKKGRRNSQRILWSNDGLIFVTYDHYRTFFEVV